MNKMSFKLESLDKTAAFGKLLASLLIPGDVVGLKGDLGAGKTFLAGAVARGLGVPDSINVTSPTFTLIKEYEGQMPIYHMDLYRLGDPAELYDLGLWEYYGGKGVCLVEWCDRFTDLWPEHALELTLKLGQGEERIIEAEGKGRGQDLAVELGALWIETA